MDNAGFGTIAGLESMHYGYDFGCMFECEWQAVPVDLRGHGAGHGRARADDHRGRGAPGSASIEALAASVPTVIQVPMENAPTPRPDTGTSTTSIARAASHVLASASPALARFFFLGLGARAQDAPPGGRPGGGPPRVRTRKVVLAWAGHAERHRAARLRVSRAGRHRTPRLRIRRVRHLHPHRFERRGQATVDHHTGTPASGGPSLTPVSTPSSSSATARCRWNRRSAPSWRLSCATRGKGSWPRTRRSAPSSPGPEFGELLGGRYDDHPWNVASGTSRQRGHVFPGHPALPGVVPVRRRVLSDEGVLARQAARVLLRLDVSKMPPNPRLRRTDGDFRWPGPRRTARAASSTLRSGTPRRRGTTATSPRCTSRPSNGPSA